jgi:hypothetical protein
VAEDHADAENDRLVVGVTLNDRVTVPEPDGVYVGVPGVFVAEDHAVEEPETVILNVGVPGVLVAVAIADEETD